MVATDLAGRRFVVVTHVYAQGPAFSLEEYLKEKVASLVFIGHPFPFARDTRSFIRVYDQGRLTSERTFRPWKGPDATFYLKDIVVTLWWLLPMQRADYFVGADVLNAFAGILLAWLGKARHVVFYTIDYIPRRFPNPLLNALYHFLDRFVVRTVHRAWNLSPVMAEERGKRGVARRYREKQLTVPIGTAMVNATPIPRFDRHRMVFLGHLRAGQGVELLLEAMTEVVKSVPQAHLLLIGGGPLEPALRSLAVKLGLTRHVRFQGFVERFADVQRLLRDACFAVAPYLDTPETFTRYADPGKPKDYLASGLPVVITKVPQVAFEIEAKRCGLAIDATKDDLVRALMRLLTDDDLVREFRRNAPRMAREYAWERVFERALRETVVNREAP